MRPDYVQVSDDTIIGSSCRLAAAGKRQERRQVLTMGDGKIVDLQGCRSRRHAECFAARRR